MARILLESSMAHQDDFELYIGRKGKALKKNRISLFCLFVRLYINYALARNIIKTHSKEIIEN